jgi:predicted alpha/beta hydrolase family esterase
MNALRMPPVPTLGAPARSRLVIVPGLHGSGSGHWQTWLHGQVPDSVRVDQDFWSVPDIERWADRIAETIDALGTGPHVVAAHSFGCLAALHATARYPGLGVARMLLVAPADPTRFNVANSLPQAPLAMPTCLVASDNDPWMSAAHAQAWALRWGSDWLNLGSAGHINADSGYGPFPLAREWAAAALNRIDGRSCRAAA